MVFFQGYTRYQLFTISHYDDEQWNVCSDIVFEKTKYYFVYCFQGVHSQAENSVE